MTIEKRTFISFKDILAIEYGCPHCYVRQSVPIEKVERLVFNCPNCNESLIKKNEEGGPIHDDVLMSKFFHSVKEIQQRDFSEFLRLQITTIDES